MTQTSTNDGRRALPYGSWPSDISVTSVLAGTVIFDGPRSDGQRLFWGEVHLDDDAVCGIWTLEPSGPRRLTGPQEDVRSTVYEYGGGAWAVDGGVLAYLDHATSSVKVHENGTTRVVANMPQDTRLGDLAVNASQRVVVAVREQQRSEGATHTIVRFPIDVEAPVSIAAEHVVVEGSDFYASPRLCDTGELAWVQWQHPDMPWTASRVVTMRLDSDAAEHTMVAGADGESVLHPTWTLTDTGGWQLLICSDRSGYWNLYRWDGTALTPLSPAAADMAGAPWALGGQPFAPLAGGGVACFWYEQGSATLGEIEPNGKRVPWLQTARVGRVAAAPGWVAADVDSADGPTSLLLGSHSDEPGTMSWQRLRGAPATLPAAAISHPQELTWEGEAGAVHGWYYPPASEDFRGVGSAPPPLLLLLHGGPTSVAHGAYGLDRQIWTNRGFAVLDVNYSGSTGYGREYRSRLDGRWGDLDVSDAVAGAHAAIAAGLADANAILIRGASAGGYTALRAAASSDVFAGVVSIYGVTDVADMARQTHKLESHYIQRLVGEPLLAGHDDGSDTLSTLACPVLLIHGRQDKVVPLAQAEKLATSLRERAVDVEVIVFDEEAHGFRKPDNLERSFEVELSFYRGVLAASARERGRR